MLLLFIEIEKNLIPLTHIYVTAHFPGLEGAINKKWIG